MKAGSCHITASKSASVEEAIGIRGTAAARIRENLPAIVFWCSAIFILFWSLGAKGLWGPEDRWAEVVREMRLTGDYLHPTINGIPYFDKPLLSYWLIALSAAVTGRLDEWVVRLPSAIAGLLSLIGVMSLGRRLWSGSVARAACWVLLGSYGFIFWARTGEADMENMAAIILAVAWYWARRDKPGFLSYLVFYLICFLGAHAKGMATIAVPMVVVLPDLIRERRWRSYLSFSHLLALVIGLSVYLAPFVIADATRSGYGASGLAAAIKENVARYFRPFDHKEPFYVYFYHLPKLLFPWIPLFIGALWLLCSRFKRLDWPGKWLVVSTALVFLFFTLSGSRRSYYILPILPFCVLVVALYITIEPDEQRRSAIIGFQKWIFFIIMGAEILSPVIWLSVRHHVDFVMSRQLLFATACLGILASACLILSLVRSARLAQILGVEKDLTGLIVMSVVLMGGFFCWQDGLLETYRTEKPFSMELKSRIQSLGAGQIAFFRKFPIKTLFYMDLPEPVLVLKDVGAAKPFLDSANGTRILVSHYDYYSELVGVLTEENISRPALEEKVYPWENEKKYEAWIVTDCK